jgi:hypothetical protein
MEDAMQTQQRTTDGFWAFHDHCSDWMHRELPALNRAAEDGHLNPEELVAAVRPWINELGAKHVPGVRQISPWEARKLIQLTGFLVSSVERHFQAASAAPGVGLSRLAGADHMLRELARVAQHPPRDSHYLTPEDWHALEADMTLPSVADVLLQQLELTPQEVITCNSHALEAHIARQSPELQASLVAYADLFHAAGKLTAMHWALIQNYLIKPAAKLSQAERARLPVPPDHGTGGQSPEETKAIRDMRREHPVLKKLIDGINRALSTSS